MRIEDGTGKGYQLKVTSENMLTSLSYNEFVEHLVNHKYKKCYSVVIDEQFDENSVFFYIKNNDEEDMIITSLKLFSDSSTCISLIIGSIGNPVNGVDIQPVNRNTISLSDSGSFIVMKGNITGLSNGKIVDKIVLNSEIATNKYTWNSGLIITKNSTFILKISNTATITGTVSLHFQSGDL